MSEKPPNPAAWFEMLQLAARQANSGEGVAFGRYRLLELVGQGGMGLVYKAFDSQLNRLLALKQLNPVMITDRTDVDRFLGEAQSAARLKHPNIVQIFDIGDIDGLIYFTMDWISGDMLHKIKDLSPRRKTEIIRTIAEALAYAHNLGVVHRDIKPSNIMITPSGKPVLMDFGIAFDLSRSSKITATGDVLGTPAYMSPEQAKGERDKIDGRTDIYSLGVTLFELLTGRLPHVGATAVDVMQSIVNNDAPRPRSINPKIDVETEGVIIKAMEKNVERRYATAQDFADDLGRALAGEATVAGKVTLRKTFTNQFRRNWRLLGIFALAGVILASFGYLSYELYTLREAAPAPETSAYDEGLRLLSEARGPFLNRSEKRSMLVQAAQKFSFALEVEPTLAEARRRRGEIYLALGRPAEAAKDFENSPVDRLRVWIRLLLPRSSFPEFQKTEGRDLDDRLRELARPLKADAGDEAKLLYRVARAALAEIDGNHLETLSTLGGVPPKPEFLALRARAAGLQGDEDRELEWLTRAVELDPWFAQGWAQLADLRARRLEFDRALEACDRAGELLVGPYVPALHARAMALVARGDFVGAESALGLALAAGPSNADLLHDRAVAQLFQGDAQSALDTFQKALDLRPYSIPTAYLLACAAAQSRQLDRAFKALKEALGQAESRKLFTPRGASENKPFERLAKLFKLRAGDVAKDPLLEPLRRLPSWDREIKPILEKAK